MTDLTPKQERFVEEYLVDLNAAQAAIRAGYSKKAAKEQGYENLTKPHIQEAIKKAMDDRSERVEASQDYVLESVIETMERSKQAKPVTEKNGTPIFTETPDGEIVPAYTFNAAAVLKGAEILGKHLGMFVDKLEISDKRSRDEIISRANELNDRYGAGGISGGPGSDGSKSGKRKLH